MPITLNAYRSRFLPTEATDTRYQGLAELVVRTETIATPALMIQGADDRCDLPSASEDQQRFFTGRYQRVVLEGVGHFPHREAPGEVAAAIEAHLRRAGSCVDSGRPSG